MPEDLCIIVANKIRRAQRRSQRENSRIIPACGRRRDDCTRLPTDKIRQARNTILAPQHCHCSKEKAKSKICNYIINESDWMSVALRQARDSSENLQQLMIEEQPNAQTYFGLVTERV